MSIRKIKIQEQILLSPMFITDYFSVQKNPLFYTISPNFQQKNAQIQKTDFKRLSLCNALCIHVRL